MKKNRRTKLGLHNKILIALMLLIISGATMIGCSESDSVLVIEENPNSINEEISPEEAIRLNGVLANLVEYMGEPVYTNKDKHRFIFTLDVQGKEYEGFRYFHMKANRFIKIKDSRITAIFKDYSANEMLDDNGGYDLSFDISDNRFGVYFNSSKTGASIVNYYPLDDRFEGNYIFNTGALKPEYEKYLRESGVLEYMKADLETIRSELKSVGIDLEDLDKLDGEEVAKYAKLEEASTNLYEEFLKGQIYAVPKDGRITFSHYDMDTAETVNEDKDKLYLKDLLDREYLEYKYNYDGTDNLLTDDVKEETWGEVFDVRYVILDNPESRLFIDVKVKDISAGRRVYQFKVENGELKLDGALEDLAWCDNISVYTGGFVEMNHGQHMPAITVTYYGRNPLFDLNETNISAYSKVLLVEISPKEWVDDEMMIEFDKYAENVLAYDEHEEIAADLERIFTTPKGELIEPSILNIDEYKEP